MPEDALALLEAAGLIEREGGSPRTTRRWRAAMARAALWLQQSGAPWDLKLPIVAALIELRGDGPDEEIAALVEALLPFERVAGGEAPATGAAPR